MILSRRVIVIREKHLKFGEIYFSARVSAEAG